MILLPPPRHLILINGLQIDHCIKKDFSFAKNRRKAVFCVRLIKKAFGASPHSHFFSEEKKQKT